MSGIGCSDNVLKWFASYLSGPRQRVVLDGQASDWTPVLAGVLQGSILGTLLFLLYINDIDKHIGYSVRLFADDTSLYIIVEFQMQRLGVGSRFANYFSVGRRLVSQF